MDVRWHLQNLTASAGLTLLKLSGAWDDYWGHWRGPLFDRAERMGLHVLPTHYYSPVPTTSALSKEVWKARKHAVGVDLNLDAALVLLEELSAAYHTEYSAFSRTRGADRRKFSLANSGYRAGDAEIYYAMLRRFKPSRVIEIGCGNSTLVACMALGKNREEAPNEGCHYVCIEPYLPTYLRPAPKGVTEIIEKPVQDVSLDVFKMLRGGDFLFIDSSHVAALGSDVVYEYLEILPQLNGGVIVHIHDIFLPFEYPESWARKQRFFWNEQYVLHAMLSGSSDFEVLLPAYALFQLRPESFRTAFPSIEMTNQVAAFWIRKKR